MKNSISLLVFSYLFSFCCAQTLESIKDIKKTPCCISNFQLDSTYVNYIIQENKDTLFFNSFEVVVKCNYLQSLDKEHNKCRLILNDEFITGNIILHLEGKDNIMEYRGSVITGYYTNGSINKYYLNKSLMMTGKYENNAKIGIWKTYYPNGKIESKQKFVEGIDESIKEKYFKNK